MDVRPIQEPERAPLTAAYLAGLLGAYDADPLSGESFAFLLRSDLDDPTEQFRHLDVVGRRLLPPTQGAALGRAHDRPVPGSAARRSGRRGGPSEAERPGPSTTPPAPARCRSRRACRSSRPCSTSRRGSCRSPMPGRRRRDSASACGRSCCARRRPSSSSARASPRPRDASCTSGRTGCASSRSRRGRRSRSPPRTMGRGWAPMRTTSASVSGCRSATSSTRAGTTPARTSARCFGRSSPWPRRAARTTSPMTSSGRPGSSWSAPARTIAPRSLARRPGTTSARASATRRSSPSAVVAGLVRGARAAILPTALGCGGPGRQRGDRLRDTGRGVGRRRPARPRRGRRDPGRAARPGEDWPSPCGPPGPTTACTIGSRPTPGSEPPGSAAPGPTWPARPGPSTPRSGSPERPDRSSGRADPQPAGEAETDGAAVTGGASDPALNETGEPSGMTWMKVCPMVSVTSRPFES